MSSSLRTPLRLAMMRPPGLSILVLLTLHGLVQHAVAWADETAPGKNAGKLSQQIDQRLQSSWQADGITPAPRCDDETFVRRIYLDLTGRIPTVDQRRAFLEDNSETKRETLVSSLIASDGFAVHLADTFDTLLMGRGNRQRYRERMEHQWRAWLERVFRENRPWDAIARDVLLARPESPEDQGAVWYLYERNDDHQAIAEAVAADFFGIRIDCAQCHDHMIASEIEQQHYWGLVAFFNRSKNEKGQHGPRIAESAVGGFSEFVDLTGGSSPNLLTFFDAATIDEPRPETDAKPEDSDALYVPSGREGDPRVPKFSRRQKFVQEILSDHPLVARAFVNRIWALLMGRGIVHPFDQMDSAHDASHPELLDLLAEDFRTSGYDIRHLIQAIVNSEAYQLDSRRPDGVDDPATFAWHLHRPLTAEQLARSIQLGLHGRTDNDHPLVAELREKIPDVMPETMLTDVEESLFLSNNPVITDLFVNSDAPDDLLTRLSLSASVNQAIETMFIALLGRLPDSDEADAMRRYLQPSPAAGEEQQTPPDRLRNALWAMITSAEFRFNH